MSNSQKQKMRFKWGTFCHITQSRLQYDPLPTKVLQNIQKISKGPHRISYQTNFQHKVHGTVSILVCSFANMPDIQLPPSACRMPAITIYGNSQGRSIHIGSIGGIRNMCLLTGVQNKQNMCNYMCKQCHRSSSVRAPKESTAKTSQTFDWHFLCLRSYRETRT